jgi:lysophospholipase L1-like esterase
MNSPPAYIWKASFSIAFTVVLLIAIELASAIYIQIRTPRRAGLQNAQASASVSVYKDQPWAPTYWREEVAAFKILYDPYVIWRRAPYKGETIEIDENGLRRTFHSQCTAPNYTIWVFGGSTLWGAGSPDWFTIPSLLAEQYEKSGKPACVINYGTTAWVNTQEVIKLMLELKRASRKPDLVVFYDGVNDSFTLNQSGMIDVPQNIDLLQRKFESGQPVQWGWTMPLEKTPTMTESFRYLLQTNTARMIFSIASRLHPPSSDSTRQVSNDQIRRQMEMAYLKNLEFVDALGQQYGFKRIFFWQPVIFAGHKALNGEEEAMLCHMREIHPGIQSVYQGMYDLAQKTSRPEFFDIADVFDTHPETIYIDFCHLSPEGNRLVAKRMYGILHGDGQ